MSIGSLYGLLPSNQKDRAGGLPPVISRFALSLAILWVCGPLFASASPAANAPTIDDASTATPTTPVPRPGITPFLARYELRLNGFKVGEAEVRMSRTADGRIIYQRDSQAKGILALIRNDRIHERAITLFEDNEFKPLAFEYRHTGGGRVREEEVRFDWENRVARSNHRGDKNEFAIEPGVLDRMTLELAVMRDVAAGRDTLSYPIVAYGKHRQWLFHRHGQEQVETPAGRFLALVVQREHHNHQRATTFWLSYTMAYLPVRVLYREKNGDQGELLLLDAKING